MSDAYASIYTYSDAYVSDAYASLYAYTPASAQAYTSACMHTSATTHRHSDMNI